MKINDKNLAYFAVSDTPVDKEGYLLKRGEVNKNFQKRWFVLKGNLLFYFDRKTDKEPVGVVVLEGCTIELAENEDQFTFKMVFHGAGGRTYVLGAESQELMEEWMKVLACASYDYMKLMVAELQRQLDELSATEAAAAAASSSQSKNISNQQRVNPFDRCRISDDSGDVKTKISPVPLRKAPPPPSPVIYRSSNKIPTSSQSQEQLQMSSSFENVSTKKTFRELHEEYGRKIKQQQISRGNKC